MSSSDEIKKILACCCGDPPCYYYFEACPDCDPIIQPGTGFPGSGGAESAGQASVSRDRLNVNNRCKRYRVECSRYDLYQSEPPQLDKIYFIRQHCYKYIGQDDPGGWCSIGTIGTANPFNECEDCCADPAPPDPLGLCCNSCGQQCLDNAGSGMTEDECQQISDMNQYPWTWHEGQLCDNQTEPVCGGCFDEPCAFQPITVNVPGISVSGAIVQGQNLPTFTITGAPANLVQDGSCGLVAWCSNNPPLCGPITTIEAGGNFYEARVIRYLVDCNQGFCPEIQCLRYYAQIQVAIAPRDFSQGADCQQWRDGIQGAVQYDILLIKNSNSPCPTGSDWVVCDSISDDELSLVGSFTVTQGGGRVAGNSFIRPIIPRPCHTCGGTPIVKWLGLEWYGIPKPIRYLQWVRGENNDHPGCGCIKPLKDLWEKARAYATGNRG